MTNSTCIGVGSEIQALSCMKLFSFYIWLFNLGFRSQGFLVMLQCKFPLHFLNQIFSCYFVSMEVYSFVMGFFKCNYLMALQRCSIINVMTCFQYAHILIWLLLFVRCIMLQKKISRYTSQWTSSRACVAPLHKELLIRFENNKLFGNTKILKFLQLFYIIIVHCYFPISSGSKVSIC